MYVPIESSSKNDGSYPETRSHQIEQMKSKVKSSIRGKKKNSINAEDTLSTGGDARQRMKLLMKRRSHLNNANEKRRNLVIFEKKKRVDIVETKKHPSHNKKKYRMTNALGNKASEVVARQMRDIRIKEADNKAKLLYEKKLYAKKIKDLAEKKKKQIQNDQKRKRQLFKKQSKKHKIHKQRMQRRKELVQKQRKERESKYRLKEAKIRVVRVKKMQSQVERKKRRHAADVSKHKAVAMKPTRVTTPGPGAYSLPPSCTTISGGSWSCSVPRSYLDISIAEAKHTPAPGGCGKIQTTLNQSGGKFNISKPLSDTDILIKRAASTPGPADYSKSKSFVSDIRGGSFAPDIVPKPEMSDLDWILKRAREVPAPGHTYDAKKSFVSDVSGGKFNLSNPMSDIDLKISRASRTPGPAQYYPCGNIGDNLKKCKLAPKKGCIKSTDSKPYILSTKKVKLPSPDELAKIAKMRQDRAIRVKEMIKKKKMEMKKIKLKEEKERQYDIKLKESLREGNNDFRKCRLLEMQRERQLNKEKMAARQKLRAEASKAAYLKKKRAFVLKMIRNNYKIINQKRERFEKEKFYAKTQKRKIAITNRRQNNQAESSVSSPGPGEYTLPSTLAISGGTWSKSSGYSDVEIRMKEAALTPGRAYVLNTPKVSGGKFNSSSAPSDVEILQKRAAEMPSPGQYNLPSTLVATGGIWGKHIGMTITEEVTKNADQIPAPGFYTVHQPKISGGKFNLSNPMSDIEALQKKSRSLPGPGEYTLPSTLAVSGGTWGKSSGYSDVEIRMKEAALTPGRGKFSTSNAPTDIDILQKRAASTPGPGQYIFPDQYTKAGGTWGKHIGMTITEEVIKHANQTPAPGFYTVHQPKISGGKFNLSNPISDVQILQKKSRSLPGPGEYTLPSTLAVSGGTWGKSSGYSDVEIRMKEAALTPGRAYVLNTPKVSGGKFNSSSAPSDVEILQKRAAEMPSPGQYNLPSTLVATGGTWGKHIGMTSTEAAMKRNENFPGPGHYTASSTFDVVGSPTWVDRQNRIAMTAAKELNIELPPNLFAHRDSENVTSVIDELIKAEYPEESKSHSASQPQSNKTKNISKVKLTRPKRRETKRLMTVSEKKQKLDDAIIYANKHTRDKSARKRVYNIRRLKTRKDDEPEMIARGGKRTLKKMPENRSKQETPVKKTDDSKTNVTQGVPFKSSVSSNSSKLRNANEKPTHDSSDYRTKELNVTMKKSDTLQKPTLTVHEKNMKNVQAHTKKSTKTKRGIDPIMIDSDNIPFDHYLLDLDAKHIEENKEIEVESSDCGKPVVAPNRVKEEIPRVTIGTDASGVLFGHGQEWTMPQIKKHQSKSKRPESNRRRRLPVTKLSNEIGEDNINARTLGIDKLSYKTLMHSIANDKPKSMEIPRELAKDLNIPVEKVK